MIAERISHHGRCWIIADASLHPPVTAEFFAPDFWQGRIVGSAPGRARALFVDHGDQRWVLRHYHRGGLPGRLIADRYLYAGLDRSRPVREWRTLAAAHAAGVAVPRPVAAALHRQGPVYRGDILLQRIDGAHSLADLLAQGEMPADWWAALAQVIAGCHRAGFWHADLNARNVICRQGRWWLIDFDRARQRPPGNWGWSNLQRLKRSLDKISAAGGLRYTASDWQGFLRAYQVSLN